MSIDILQIILCFCYVKEDFLGPHNSQYPQLGTIKLYAAVVPCHTISLV